jgi:hypothetical protein
MLIFHYGLTNNKIHKIFGFSKNGHLFLSIFQNRKKVLEKITKDFTTCVGNFLDIKMLKFAISPSLCSSFDIY